jgi:hypothetical protein
MERMERIEQIEQIERAENRGMAEEMMLTQEWGMKAPEVGGHKKYTRQF